MQSSARRLRDGICLVRVVAGEAKGHRLKAPKGTDTRPTSDKVREAIFDMLAGQIEGENVLDLFAGTGALGIEALSRGAESAVFVERRREACQVIKANLEHTKLADRARVSCASAERAIEALNETFGLILLDPPYAYGTLDDIMSLISASRVVEDATTVVFEHSPRFVVQDRYGRLKLKRQKVYGDTAVSIYVVQEDEKE